MGKTERRLNKWILGAVIGSAVIGLTGFSMSPKGKSFWKRLQRKAYRGVGFLQRGYAMLKEEVYKVARDDKKGKTK